MKASAQRKRSGYEQETHKKKKENMYNDLTLMLCSFGAIAILWQSNWQSAEEEERQLPDRSNCNSHNGGRGRNEWVKRGWQGLNAPLEH